MVERRAQDGHEMKGAEGCTPVGKCYSYILAQGTAATAITQNSTCTIAHAHLINNV